MHSTIYLFDLCISEHGVYSTIYLFDLCISEQQEEMLVSGSVTNKKRTLEDLFRPPIDLTFKGTFTNVSELYNSPPLMRPLPPKVRYQRHWYSKIIQNIPLKRGHPSYQARYQMHWYSKIIQNVPLKKGHLSYQARYQMHWDGKRIQNVPLKKGHPSYHARYQMHWDGKRILNYPPQERPPFLISLYDQFFMEKRWCYKRRITIASLLEV